VVGTPSRQRQAAVVGDAAVAVADREDLVDVVDQPVEVVHVAVRLVHPDQAEQHVRLAPGQHPGPAVGVGVVVRLIPISLPATRGP